MILAGIDRRPLRAWRNGRRGGLKIRSRKTCRFESDRPHHHPLEIYRSLRGVVSGRRVEPSPAGHNRPTADVVCGRRTGPHAFTGSVRLADIRPADAAADSERDGQQEYRDCEHDIRALPLPGGSYGAPHQIQHPPYPVEQDVGDEERRKCVRIRRVTPCSAEADPDAALLSPSLRAL